MFCLFLVVTIVRVEFSDLFYRRYLYKLKTLSLESTADGHGDSWTQLYATAEQLWSVRCEKTNIFPRIQSWKFMFYEWRSWEIIKPIHSDFRGLLTVVEANTFFRSSNVCFFFFFGDFQSSKSQLISLKIPTGCNKRKTWNPFKSVD